MFSCVSSEINLETNVDLEKYMDLKASLETSICSKELSRTRKASGTGFSSPVYLLVSLLLIYFVFVKTVLLSACSYIGK